MPLTADMQLVSVDDHLIEKPEVWLSRVPRRFRDSCPRVVEASGTETDQYGFGQKVPKGSQVWQLEGKVYGQLGLNAVAGKPSTELGTEPLRFSDMIEGCYDPVARVKDMDIDGVQAQMLFPSFPRFAGTMFQNLDDKDLARACTSAWNDYVLDEWCLAFPGRFIPMIILPYWSIDESVAELDRAAHHNVRAVSFPENPVPLGLPSFHTSHWDRLFAELEAREIVVSMHFGTSGQVIPTAPEAPMAVFISLMGLNSMRSVCDLIFSPTFHKFPDLKVSVAEGGIGWIPWLVERMDITWERHRFYQNVNQMMRPSDIFARNIFGCFISDQYGVDNRHRIGLDNITWECDYPHSDSFWPNSRKVVAEMFHEVPDHEVRAIVEDNARRLYRFPRS
ncbi:amidohydrolase family protein [Mycobacterium sp. URHB0044]|jgi:predicted TIM-barrel fold metal-dependent hydrolase|uniref:amidohydrolase family protein n=1 Tax=Mycobacterium sp. URHB0044 TaxID=1380386 RepID=UPI00048D38E6|nr:amidohydrolase family protein [Mycobacterium sp. URHB0044]